MDAVLQILVLALQGMISVLVAYLLLLTAAAQRAARQTVLPSTTPTHRFLILIPAHNEEQLLPALLDSIAQLDYPKALYAVHVVADNCTDGTTAVAQHHGAHVHERTNDELRGKGYALQWLLERLWRANISHGAVVILDADSTVSPNFLRVMDARLARGERVIQAYYSVRGDSDSWNVGLRYAAFAVLHYLRPLGRMVLGGSAGLKGNGMVFAADVLRRHPWSASITEDIEYHMALLLDGERVTFAPDATVQAEMPQTLKDATSQHTRWEQGRVETARRYVPQLLRASANASDRRRAYALLDAVMEHMIPPFSLLAAATGFATLVALLAPPYRARRASRLRRTNVALGGALLAGQAAYVLTGLHMVRAPRKVYAALLFAPVLVAWKLALLARVALGRGPSGWVRTARSGGGR